MMAMDRLKLTIMTDTQIASAILSGEIKDLSSDDWQHLNSMHPTSLRIYALALAVLGY